MFNSDFNFVIKSVSLEKREVSGILTAQVRDKDGEALDYDGSKPYFIAWSTEIQDATRHLGEDKMSYGNVREQHSKKCVGKFIRLEFDDNHKTIYGVAKITDDAAWENCKEGVYNAFSVGGVMVSSRRENNIKYIIIKPREVSIVDNPALSVTHFDFVKDAATTIEKAFKSEKQLSDTSLGESTMANDVEKAAHKSLVEHVHALKAAVTVHKEACIKAASDHEGDMHGACDKVLEKLGGAMHGEPDEEEKAVGTSDVQKALEAIKTLIAEVQAMKDEKVATEKAAADKLQAEKAAADRAATEKAAADKLEADKAEADRVAKAAEVKVTGDRDDTKETGTTQVEKAALAKKESDFNLDLARRGMGDPTLGLAADPQALATLYDRVVKPIQKAARA